MRMCSSLARVDHPHDANVSSKQGINEEEIFCLFLRVLDHVEHVVDLYALGL
jgi:hypothetical protein